MVTGKTQVTLDESYSGTNFDDCNDWKQIRAEIRQDTPTRLSEWPSETRSVASTAQPSGILNHCATIETTNT